MLSEIMTSWVVLGASFPCILEPLTPGIVNPYKVFLVSLDFYMFVVRI